MVLTCSRQELSLTSHTFYIFVPVAVVTTRARHIIKGVGCSLRVATSVVDLLQCLSVGLNEDGLTSLVFLFFFCETNKQFINCYPSHYLIFLSPNCNYINFFTCH